METVFGGPILGKLHIVARRIAKIGTCTEIMQVAARNKDWGSILQKCGYQYSNAQECDPKLTGTVFEDNRTN